MINPYSGVNWASTERVVSCSHEHCETQAQFNNLIANGGLQHFAISNYYPSTPVYPIESVFSNVPDGAISSPNAEHHNMDTYNLHLNGLGSFYSSGKPRGQTPVGVGGVSWKNVAQNIINNLQFSDGGGVTINHPVWTGLSTQQIAEMLDFDNRVLGIEVFNSGTNNQPTDIWERPGWDLIGWDEILKTGRRCWGFFVADHGGETMPNWYGRNILLVDEVTEHECLKAYRNGNFYGQCRNTDLAFTQISYSNNVIHAETENADQINIIVDGNSYSFSGNTAEKTVSNATYIRVEAKNDTYNDAIFSNPIILKEHVKKKNNRFFNSILLD